MIHPAQMNRQRKKRNKGENDLKVTKKVGEKGKRKISNEIERRKTIKIRTKSKSIRLKKSKKRRVTREVGVGTKRKGITDSFTINLIIIN